MLRAEDIGEASGTRFEEEGDEGEEEGSEPHVADDAMGLEWLSTPRFEGKEELSSEQQDMEKEAT
jgi:hypothetical protein